MILQVNTQINEQESSDLREKVQSFGFSINEIRTQTHLYFICLGENKGDIRQLGNLKNVIDVHRVEDRKSVV